MTYQFLVSFQLKEKHSAFVDMDLDDEQADRIIALVRDPSSTLRDKMAAFTPELLSDHIFKTAREWFVMERIDNDEVEQELLDEASHSVDLESMDLVYYLMDNDKFWNSVSFDPRAAITDIEYLDTIHAHRVTNRTDNKYLPSLLKDVIRACGYFYMFPRDIVIEDYDLDDVYLSCGDGDDGKYDIRMWNIEEKKGKNEYWIEWTLFRDRGESQGAERIAGDTTLLRIFDVGETIYSEAWNDRNSLFVFLADGETVKVRPHDGNEWTGEDILSHLEIAGLDPGNWRFAQDDNFTYVASDEDEVIALMSNEMFDKFLEASEFKPVKTEFGKLKP